VELKAPVPVKMYFFESPSWKSSALFVKGPVSLKVQLFKRQRATVALTDKSYSFIKSTSYIKDSFFESTELFKRPCRE
jgi:hypothetical protein